MLLHDQVNGADDRDEGADDKKNDVHSYWALSATSRPVIKRFTMATGNMNTHAKCMSWSYRKRGSVPRIQIYRKRIKPTLAANQKNGSRMVLTTGTRNTPATTKEMTAAAGRVYLSRRRAGFRPAYSATKPASTNKTVGTKFEPYSGFHNGCQPPRNSNVPMQDTVIMFAYSAMKKAANFMLPYSV